MQECLLRPVYNDAAMSGPLYKILLVSVPSRTRASWPQ